MKCDFLESMNTYKVESALFVRVWMKETELLEKYNHPEIRKVCDEYIDFRYTQPRTLNNNVIFPKKELVEKLSLLPNVTAVEVTDLFTKDGIVAYVEW